MNVRPKLYDLMVNGKDVRVLKNKCFNKLNIFIIFINY